MDNSDFSALPVISAFDEATKKPEEFVRSTETFTSLLRSLLKQMYDCTKKEEPSFDLHKVDALPELIIEHFDLEQIWQQVELQNGPLLSTLATRIDKLKGAKLMFALPENQLTIDDDKNEDSGGDNDGDSGHEESPNKDEDELDSQSNKSFTSSSEHETHDENEMSKGKSSAVDDQFFKLNEMSNFLAAEDKKWDKKKPIMDGSNSESEESVNMFGEGSDDEDADDNDKLKNPRYKDFFRNKNRERRVMFADDNWVGGTGEDANSSNDQKSSLELRDERLQTKIREIEETAVKEKPWQLKGEVMAENRPQNSLLEEVLEFDLTSRPAPVITEETTHVLEDVIRQRIKDKAFDDVERKQKFAENPTEYRKKLLLDQEKSKQSLAQIYESEYVKQQQALDPGAGEREPDEPPEHKDITTLMQSLFRKLDTLSNFHYTPKPVVPELKIISNVPAINMEEVAPVAVSDAALLAPEEVRRKGKGDAIGKGERTDADKKRERRRKKSKQKVHAKLKQDREARRSSAVNGKRKSKDRNASKGEKTESEFGGKGVKSSTAFFTALQESVQSNVKVKRKTSNNVNVNAKKIKL